MMEKLLSVVLQEIDNHRKVAKLLADIAKGTLCKLYIINLSRTLKHGQKGKVK